MAATFGKTWTEGATWTLDIACKDAAGGALDINAHEKHVLLSRRGVAALHKSATTADSNFIEVSTDNWDTGLLRIKLIPADHASLTPGIVYACEIWTEAPDGTVYDQAAGTIEVRASGIPLAS